MKFSKVTVALSAIIAVVAAGAVVVVKHQPVSAPQIATAATKEAATLPPAQPLPKIQVTEVSAPTPAPAVPNYSEGLPSLDEAAAALRNMPTEEVQKQLTQVTQTIAAGLWIERANAHTLSDAELRQLAAMMHREEALRLSLIQRQLNDLEEEYL